MSKKDLPACPRCGAHGEGQVCAYCKAPMLAPGDERAELAELERLHAAIKEAQGRKEPAGELIAGGFMPTGKKVLIEAGLRCLPTLADAVYEADEDQWLARLEMIRTRLNLLTDEDARRACAEFDARLADYRKRSRHDTVMGLGCFALLLALLIAVGWWLARRFGWA